MTTIHREGWITVGVAIALFLMLLSNKIATDFAFMFCLMVLVFTGVITEDVAVKGFANTSMLTVAALFVVAQGMESTGAIRLVTKRLFVTNTSLHGATLRLTIPVAMLSAFFNNTPIVAMLMGEVISWCRKMGHSPSRLLMHLSNAAVLGGVLTIMGTSTNLLVSGLLEQAKKPKLGLFSVAPIGACVCVVGIATMVFLGRFLIGDRGLGDAVFSNPQQYTAELIVDEKGPLASGRRLCDLSIPTISGEHAIAVSPIEIIRGGEVIPAPASTQVVIGGDRLVFAGVLAHILPLQHIAGLRLASDHEFETGNSAPKLNLSPASLLRRFSTFRNKFSTRKSSVNSEGASPAHSVAGDNAVAINVGAESPTVTAAADGDVESSLAGVGVGGGSPPPEYTSAQAGIELQVQPPSFHRIDIGGVEDKVDVEEAPEQDPAPAQPATMSIVSGGKRDLFEVVISHRSPLVGKPVGDGSFRRQYDAAVVAVSRQGELVPCARLSDWVLQAGDFLLIDARPSFRERHLKSTDFYIVNRQDLELTPTPIPGRWRAPFALVCLVAMISLAAAEVTSMFMASWACAVVFILTGIVSVTDARRSFDLNVLITIAGSLGLGSALDSSGVAKAIANGLISLSGGHSAWGSLAAIYIAALLITEGVSNNACAAILFPVAMATAKSLNVDYMPYIMAIMIGSSAGFALPWGYQCSLMIYGPGRYKMIDFLRMGIVLDLVVAGVCIGLIPLIYPF